MILAVGTLNARQQTATTTAITRTYIHFSRESNHVSKAGHTVGATSTSISLRKTRVLNTINVIHHVYLSLLLTKWDADGGTGGRYVLYRNKPDVFCAVI